MPLCFFKTNAFFWQDQCQTLAMQNVCAKGAWVLGWDGVVMEVSHLVHGFSHVYSFKGSLLASHGFLLFAKASMASHAMPGSNTTTPVPQCRYSNFKTRYYTMIF